jgi:hypothetical protein
MEGIAGITWRGRGTALAYGIMRAHASFDEAPGPAYTAGLGLLSGYVASALVGLRSPSAAIAAPARATLVPSAAITPNGATLALAGTF